MAHLLESVYLRTSPCIAARCRTVPCRTGVKIRSYGHACVGIRLFRVSIQLDRKKPRKGGKVVGTPTKPSRPGGRSPLAGESWRARAACGIVNAQQPQTALTRPDAITPRVLESCAKKMVDSPGQPVHPGGRSHWRENPRWYWPPAGQASDSPGQRGSTQYSSTTHFNIPERNPSCSRL
jgi:hypothetical protein